VHTIISTTLRKTRMGMVSVETRCSEKEMEDGKENN
jgi:hypothetical protein